MNTNLLIEQLIVAIVASAIVVPTIQKIKVWFPAKYVELFSSIVSMLIGFLVAVYYAKMDVIASSWVAFYSLVGAEAIYQTLKSKLETYTEKTSTIVPIEEVSAETEQGIG